MFGMQLGKTGSSGYGGTGTGYALSEVPLLSAGILSHGLVEIDQTLIIINLTQFIM
jgi:hypothetical protein